MALQLKWLWKQVKERTLLKLWDIFERISFIYRYQLLKKNMFNLNLNAAWRHHILSKVNCVKNKNFCAIFYVTYISIATTLLYWMHYNATFANYKNQGSFAKKKKNNSNNNNNNKKVTKIKNKNLQTSYSTKYQFSL